MGRQQAQEEPVVPVRPVHHRRDGEAVGRIHGYDVAVDPQFCTSCPLSGGRLAGQPISRCSPPAASAFLGEGTGRPVFGIAEAGMSAALSLGERFGVVAILSASAVRCAPTALASGYAAAAASVWKCRDAPVRAHANGDDRDRQKAPRLRRRRRVDPGLRWHGRPVRPFADATVCRSWSLAKRHRSARWASCCRGGERGGFRQVSSPVARHRRTTRRSPRQKLPAGPVPPLAGPGARR